MNTSTIEVGQLVSALSAAGVQKQLESLSGVHHADVNYVAGSATEHYDETKTTLKAIRQRVVDCGYHCGGEMLPAHICDPSDTKSPPDAHAGHATPGQAGHTMPVAGAVRGLSKGAKPKSPTKADPHADHQGDGSAACMPWARRPT